MKSIKYFLVFLTLSLVVTACKTQDNREEDYLRIKNFEQELFSNTSSSISQQKADSVIMLYENFVAKYKDDTLSANYLVRAADVAIQMENGKKAIELLDKVINNYPEAKEVPMALYFKGMTYNDVLRDTVKATEAYQMFLDKYPTHARAEEVKVLKQAVGLSNEEFLNSILNQIDTTSNK